MKKYILLFLLIGIAGWYAWDNHPDFRNTIQQYVDNGDFITFEVKYPSKQLLEHYRNELIADGQHSLQEPVLQYYPYLMLNVKYAQSDKKTRESNILWGMTDGEMVIDTGMWETTYGFADAINADASRNDLKILLVLAKNNGLVSCQGLQKELHLESAELATQIESVCQKQLAVLDGQELQLHLSNPKINIYPQTYLRQILVAKPYHQAKLMPKKFSTNQITKIANATFGPGFTIRNITEVYLPVYALSTLNPDNTSLTTYWNAVTGHKMDFN